MGLAGMGLVHPIWPVSLTADFRVCAETRSQDSRTAAAGSLASVACGRPPLSITLLRTAGTCMPMTDNTSSESQGPCPGPPPAREQQRQAERLGAAVAAAPAAVTALEPQRPLSMVVPGRASEPGQEKLIGIDGL